MSYRAEALADSPVAGWSFRSATTSVPDETGNGYTGAVDGTVNLQQPSATGDAGDYSAVFDAAAADAIFGAELPAELLPSAANDYTIELLIKLDPKASPGAADQQTRLWHLQPRDALWASTNNQRAGCGLWAWENHYLELWLLHSASGGTLATLQIPAVTFEVFDGSYHLITVVLDRYFVGGTYTRAIIYVDGVEVDRVEGLAGVPNMTAGTTFNPDPSRFWVGGSCSIASNSGAAAHSGLSVCEAWLYDTALSGARILAHNDALPDVVPIALAAPIELAMPAYVELYAGIELHRPEAVALALPIDLATGRVELSAPVELQITTPVALTVPIQLQHISDIDPNRQAITWRLALSINGSDYSDQLTGSVEIEQSEDASGLLDFAYIPASGAVDLAAMIGKRVVLSYVEEDGLGGSWSVTRFAGLVSEARLDPLEGVVRCQCTTDLQGALDAISRAAIDELTPGARWSPYVFEDGAQGWDYFLDRLRTLQASAWHGPDGIKVTPWATKPAADFTFTDAEVYEVLDYEPANRRALVNRITISVDYRFQRKRQRVLGVNWQTMQSWCDYLIYGYELCQRAMVQQAADGGGGWVRQGDITYIPTMPSGGYSCLAAGGAVTNIGYINNLYPETFALGARWKAARRWAQWVTERYTITIEAPQSIEGNGVSASTESYSLVSAEDITQWVSALQFDAADAVNAGGFQGVGGNAVSGDYVLGDMAKDATDDPDTGRAAADLMREVAIKAAASDLLGSHRDNSLPFVVPFQPALNLTHTVQLAAGGVSAKGKVRALVDRFDTRTGDATTEVTLALFQHDGVGLVTTSPLVPSDPPDKPDESGEGIPTVLSLRTHIGGKRTSPMLTGDEQGYFTNWLWDKTLPTPWADDPGAPSTIVYPHEFKVNYPDIEGSAVESVELQDEQAVSVEIPLDTLTFTQ